MYTPLRTLSMILLLVFGIGTILQAQPIANPILFEINPDVVNGQPQGIAQAQRTVVGNTLFFRGQGGTHGPSLWKIDASAPTPSPVLLKSYPGVGSIGQSLGTVFFDADDGRSSPYANGELYKSNGTPAGTVFIKDLQSSKSKRGSSPGNFLPFSGNRTIFSGNAEIYTVTPVPGVQWIMDMRELWITDGTATGTIPLCKGRAWAVNEAQPHGANTIFGNTLYTFLRDIKKSGSPPTTNYGLELWKSDGTVTGTVLVKDINPGVDGSLPLQMSFRGTDSGGIKFDSRRMIPLGNLLYFTARTATNGYELWRTDGTANGTQMAADIYPGPNSGFPAWIVQMGNYLYFAARNANDGDKLMRYSPTAGVELVADINPGTRPVDSSHVRWLTVVGERLFFSANDGEHGDELWVSDGIPVSQNGVTSLVADINPGSGGSYPNNAWSDSDPAARQYIQFDDGNPERRVTYRQSNGWIYFSAYDPTYKTELWRSNGLATQLLTDINQSTTWGSTDPHNIDIVANRLFFIGYHPSTGFEYYMIDLATLPKSGHAHASAPMTIELKQNAPNPFSSATMIEFSMVADAPARLSVHDVLGREVAVLLDGVRPSGMQRIAFDARDLPAGAYICRLEAQGTVLTRMMNLVK